MIRLNDVRSDGNALTPGAATPIVTVLLQLFH